jgi:hypothetical protein
VGSVLRLGRETGVASNRVDDTELRLRRRTYAFVAPDWVPHILEQNQAILERLGLSGAFWQLA